MGYAAESGIPFELGIIRNHYVGRTFIEPTDHIRHLGVKLKHSANRADAGGQAGDPGGRFDRPRHHQQEDRRDGARRRRDARCICASPRRRRRIPASTASTRRSAASCWPRSHDVEEMAELIGADSLAFISIDGLYRALGKRRPRSRRSRITATPASPATIRSPLPDQAGQRRPATQPADRERS